MALFEEMLAVASGATPSKKLTFPVAPGDVLAVKVTTWPKVVDGGDIVRLVAVTKRGNAVSDAALFAKFASLPPETVAATVTLDERLDATFTFIAISE